MSVANTIVGVLAAHGIEPDFESPQVAHAIGKLEAIALAEPGPWQYMTAGSTDRKHPLQKVLAELRRLESALQEAKRAADSHNNLEEVNAPAVFFQYVQTFTGNDAFQVIRSMTQASEGALDLGRPRPRHAPLHLRRDAFLVEMFFLLRALRGRADFDDEFLTIAAECQSILPLEERETIDQVRVRLSAVQKRFGHIFARWA